MLWIPAFILDIIKLSIAGLVVFYVVYATIKPLFERNQKVQLLELKKATLEKTLPLQLQAYERCVLFIERINPASLLIRNHHQGLGVQEMQHLLINEIRDEFQHNISQQIYISSASWLVIKRLKDDTVTMINNVARTLPPDAKSIELSRIILNHLASQEENPYDSALEILRQDIQKLF